MTTSKIASAKLVPEFEVDDLGRSLAFYVGVLGFKILAERPEDGFAYLDLDGVHLMLEQRSASRRQFSDASMEHPYGRGVNVQILVRDVEALLSRVIDAGRPLTVPVETRWYRQGDVEAGNRQFVIADPDGYLLRFFSDLGERPAAR